MSGVIRHMQMFCPSLSVCHIFAAVSGTMYLCIVCISIGLSGVAEIYLYIYFLEPAKEEDG